MKLNTNDQIALIVTEDDFVVHTFSRFEYLFDAAVSEYYKELRRRFNMTGTLKKIMVKRLEKQLEEMFSVDKEVVVDWTEDSDDDNAG